MKSSNDMSRKLQKAFDQLIPEMSFDSKAADLSDPLSEEEINAISGMNRPNRLPLKLNYVKYTAAAAILLLVMIGSFLFVRQSVSCTYLVLSVNPSIKIKMEGEKVINIRAENKEAVPIVKDIDKTQSLEEILDVIIDRINEGGYFDEKQNTIDLCITGKDADAVEVSADRQIHQTLARINVSASVIINDKADEETDIVSSEPEKQRYSETDKKEEKVISGNDTAEDHETEGAAENKKNDSKAKKPSVTEETSREKETEDPVSIEESNEDLTETSEDEIGRENKKGKKKKTDTVKSESAETSAAESDRKNGKESEKAEEPSGENTDPEENTVVQEEQSEEKEKGSEKAADKKDKRPSDKKTPETKEPEKRESIPEEKERAEDGRAAEEKRSSGEHESVKPSDPVPRQNPARSGKDGKDISKSAESSADAADTANETDATDAAESNKSDFDTSGQY